MQSLVTKIINLVVSDLNSEIRKRTIQIVIDDIIYALDDGHYFSLYSKDKFRICTCYLSEINQECCEYPPFRCSLDNENIHRLSDDDRSKIKSLLNYTTKIKGSDLINEYRTPIDFPPPIGHIIW